MNPFNDQSRPVNTNKTQCCDIIFILQTILCFRVRSKYGGPAYLSPVTQIMNPDSLPHRVSINSLPFLSDFYSET